MSDRTLVTFTFTIDVDRHAADSLEAVYPGDSAEPPVDGLTAIAEQTIWLAARLTRDHLDQYALDPGQPETRVEVANLSSDGAF